MSLTVNRWDTLSYDTFWPAIMAGNLDACTSAVASTELFFLDLAVDPVIPRSYTRVIRGLMPSGDGRWERRGLRSSEKNDVSLCQLRSNSRIIKVIIASLSMYLHVRYDMGMMYTNVCVAGTFDGLHAGHEALLFRAFAEGKRVCIGMTSDAYVRAHKPAGIRTYEKRFSDLTLWIRAHGYSDRSAIIPIDDPFEPAASDSTLEALIVSEDSRPNGEELNRRRVSRNLAPLMLIVVPLVQAEDMRPISATRVRAGEIDRVGRLVMPETLRNDLSLPLGRVLTNDSLHEVLRGYSKEKNIRIITVGDMTTKTFLDAGIIPQLMVVDNKINRMVFLELQPIYEKNTFTRHSVQSGPGYISPEAMIYLHQLFHAQSQEPSVLEVGGEEDLLTLPVVVEAPIGSVVYYGQPNEGLVEVLVTDGVKQKAAILLSKFYI